MNFRKAHAVMMQGNGFSLVELMVTIAVIGILSAATISISGNEWRRERINTAAIELVGWLEVIRNNALKQTSTSTAGGGCTITVTALASLPPGSSLASVSPSGCASETTFRIPALGGSDTYSAAITNGIGASSDQIIFTPRGTVMNTQTTDLKLRIDGTNSLRCVRITPNLGLISIGSNESASGALSSATCSNFSAF